MLFLGSALLCLFTLSLTGCGGGSGEAESARPDGAGAGEATAKDRGDADTESAGSEPAGFALEQIDLDIKDTLEGIEKGIEAKAGSEAARFVTEGFRGSIDTSLLAVSKDGSIAESHEHAKGKAVEGRDGFAAQLEVLFGQFHYIYDSFFKVKKYVDVQSDSIFAKVKQDLRGKRKDGALYQDFAYWEMRFEKTKVGWRVAKADMVDRHQLVSAAPMFRETTTGAGLFQSEPPDRAISGVDAIFRKKSDFANYDYGGISLYDVDVDGDLDIFMPNAYGPCSLYINQGDGTFKDEAKERGLVGSGGMRGAVFGDVDNDGDPDLYICRSIFHHPAVSHQSNLFYENLGDGRFRDRTIASGLRKTTPSMTATFLDYDLDGFLDLFVVSYGIGAINHQVRADNGNPSALFRNRGDGTFEDVTRKAGVGKTTYWSYALAVVDWNKDRYPDIYVANDYGPNEFYLNQGDGTFKESAEKLGIVDVGNGMGATFVDRNQDGEWDLYVTNMQSGTGQRVLTLMKDLVDEDTFKSLWKLTLGNTFFQSNAEGGLDSVAADLGIANCQWAWNGDFADFDADADLDLIVLNGYYSGAEAKDC